jgi:hypothetical protein
MGCILGKTESGMMDIGSMESNMEWALSLCPRATSGEDYGKMESGSSG